MYPVKRRRLHAVNSTLTKPFRSPLKTTLGDIPAQEGTPQSENLKPLQASSTQTASPHQSHSPVVSTLRIQTTPPVTTPEPAWTDKTSDDALQREYMSLARKLTVLRQSLDTAQQAYTFGISRQSADIETAIIKWRSVVQDTADELFEDVKQRVEKEGGVRSWLMRQENVPPDLWSEEQHVKLTDVQQRMFQLQRKDDRAEAEKYGLIDEKDTEEEVESTFTMDKMLRQLNIDLHLVGYDKEQQRWVD